MALAGVALTPGAGHAQDTWRFDVTPYAWLAGLDGTFGTLPGLPATNASSSFGDVLQDLNYAGFLLATARRGPLAFHLDGMISQTTSKDTLSGPLQARTRIESGAAFLAGMVGYAVLDNATTRIEPYAGVRAWWLDTDLSVSFPSSGRAFSRSGNDNWVDPIVGVFAQYRFDERFAVFAAGDIGGFGVGSRLEWGVLAGVTYTANEWLSLSAGWRHLYVNYRDGPTVYDVNQTGPVLGATFRF